MEIRGGSALRVSGTAVVETRPLWGEVMTETLRGLPFLSFRRGRGAVSPAEPFRGRVYQGLAAARFFAFALGIGLYVVPGIRAGETSLAIPLVALVGTVNVGRVLVPPFTVVRNKLAEEALLGTEFLLALALAIGTGGLDSPFLLICLAPVLSASLLGSVGTAAVLGSVGSLGVIVAHALAGWFTDLQLANVTSPSFLTVAILYISTTAVVVWLPFMANLNIQRRNWALATEAERQRLGQALHDDIAQTLAFLNIKGQRAEHLLTAGRASVTPSDIRDIAQGIRRAYISVRDFVDGSTRPLEGSLGDALRTLVGWWCQETGLGLHYLVSGAAQALGPDAVRHLAQIAREALVNSAKHAQASQVWLEVEWGAEAVTLRVRDEGRGFGVHQPRGLGINAMEERATVIGATLRIESEEGRGTAVTVTLPYARRGQP